MKAQSLRVFLGTAIAAACVSVVTPVATSLTATADPADNQASNDKLFALLSGGFTPADCQAGPRSPGDPFLARVFCHHQHVSSGPYGAIYSLYGNPADLSQAFNQYGAPIPCPGTSDPGPGPWQGGMMTCGHDFYPQTSGFTVTWTRNADLVLANVDGRDLTDLYGWWLANR
jgi:serine/threonine-protein kinase